MPGVLLPSEESDEDPPAARDGLHFSNRSLLDHNLGGIGAIPGERQSDGMAPDRNIFDDNIGGLTGITAVEQDRRTMGLRRHR